METKKCTKCKQNKPTTIEFFYNQKNGKNGLSSFCKDCIKKERKEYRSKPEYKEKRKKYDLNYTLSGRRLEMGRKPEQMHKSKIRRDKRRKDPEKLRHDYIVNCKWKDKNRDNIKKYDKYIRDSLKPYYVAKVLGISAKDLTKEVFENKKIIIELKRELTKNGVKIK